MAGVAGVANKLVLENKIKEKYSNLHSNERCTSRWVEGVDGLPLGGTNH